MQNTIGYILNIDGENTDLNELLQHRSLSTLPFGGRYRLLDFTMSNLVNSGVNHIGVVGSYKYSSLIDHLGTGKEWSLSRKTQNLSILAGASGVRYGDNIKVSVRDLHYNIPFLSKGSNVKDVIICSPNLITSFDFSTAHRIHRTNNADITMIFKKVHPDFNTTDNDVFVEFEKFRVSKLNHHTGKTAEHVFADMMIIKRDVLIDLVKKANELGEWDLMDVIDDNMDTLRVFGAPHTGYLARINNMQRFFETNMDLLNYDVMGVKTTIESSNLGYRYVDVETAKSDTYRLGLIVEGLESLIKYPLGGNPVDHYFHNYWLDVGRVGGVIPFILAVAITLINLFQMWKVFRNKKYENSVRFAVLGLYLGTYMNYGLEPIMDGFTHLIFRFLLVNGMVYALYRFGKTTQEPTESSAVPE